LGVKRREEKTEKRSKKRRVLSLDSISCLRYIVHIIGEHDGEQK
jgi:hypothetical protein